MKPTLNEKFLAYLALLSGLFLSLVAEYYSILGLTAIFSAAVIPVIIMGVALGVGKVTATLWLKQNWKIAPWSVRIYLFIAILVLMMVTSMGIFGFLSKAHSDQSLVSGDVQAKIAVYDEKIKTAKDNIDANRRVLKQMDEAVDQTMGRSTSETGADKAVAIRRSQQKERARIASEIAAEQKTISQLSEERAPLASEVRKVEAEVGPIKYIAAFVYGETNESILEKAVTWVIIILIVVFDPLAVILLLSSQISFQKFREMEFEEINWQARTDELLDIFEDTEGDSPKGSIDIVKEQPTVTTSTGFIAQELADVLPEAVTQIDEETATISVDAVNALLTAATQELAEEKDHELTVVPGEHVKEVARTYISEKSILEKHPYLTSGFKHFENLEPLVYRPERQEVVSEETKEIPDVERPGDYLDEPLFVQNEEQTASGLWTKTANSISKDEYEQASISRQDVTTNEWINRIKSGQISMADVPKHILPSVKAKM